MRHVYTPVNNLNYEADKIIEMANFSVYEEKSA
jgi:hypothetical protein